VQALEKYIAEQEASGAIDRSADGWRESLPRFPQLDHDAGKTYHWHLKTNVGDIRVKFLPDVAPNHVSNFLYLTQLGYFDGLVFHRVITDFMAQGGCPLGAGFGGPGYTFDGECSPSVKHDRPGLLSMANAGPGTDGSQFFLTFVATPWLDGKHTIFGEVVEGMGTVKELEKRGSRDGKPTQELRIEKATWSAD
jgi:cyclophilin family peptidyl-prolyl cis-trans isomerase